MQTYWLVGPKEAYIEQSNQFQSNNETVDTGILSDFTPRMYENEQRRPSLTNVINRLPSQPHLCPFNQFKSESFI
jgi:hypothetical protein